MVERQYFALLAVGSIPTIKDKNAKTASVSSERHLTLVPQGKQVGRNSQGEIHLCRMIRKVLAHLNGSQGQRIIRRRVATNVKSNARL